MNQLPMIIRKMSKEEKFIFVEERIQQINQMKDILMSYELLKREDYIHCDKLFKIRQTDLNNKQNELKQIIKDLEDLKNSNVEKLKSLKTSKKEQFNQNERTQE